MAMECRNMLECVPLSLCSCSEHSDISSICMCRQMLFCSSVEGVLLIRLQNCPTGRSRHNLSYSTGQVQYCITQSKRPGLARQERKATGPRQFSASDETDRNETDTRSSDVVFDHTTVNTLPFPWRNPCLIPTSILNLLECKMDPLVAILNTLGTPPALDVISA